MPFQRKWDETCPRVWNQWEADGKKWTVQDIPPEDDDKALDLLMEYMCPDEVLCKESGMMDDPESLRSIKDFWRDCLAQRMSLGCYTDVDGRKTLVALNVCVVDTIEERVPSTPIEGKAWKNVYGAMEYLEAKCDSFKAMNLDIQLHALGLVVNRNFRGARLGAKILAAREPLALSQGIKGTSTVFTGPASQSLASRVGFVTIQEVSMKELAENGYNYPKDDKRFVKLMAKKFYVE